MISYASKLTTGASGAASAVLIGLATLAAPAANATPSARSQLYSFAAVSSFCSNAQKLKATTTLTALNIIHVTADSFSGSSAAPYEGVNVSAYNAKSVLPERDEDGNIIDPNWDIRGYGGTLPFTNQVLISYGEVPATGLQIPTVISCKMKTPNALRFHYGTTAAPAQGTGGGASCASINQGTVTKVFASLTAYERRYLRFSESQIVLDPDPVVLSGPDWLFPLIAVGLPASIPTPPTTAYVGASDGLLHLQSKTLNVPRNSGGPVGPDKEGTTYCHFIAPEYLRGVVTGQVAPFVSPYFPN